MAQTASAEQPGQTHLAQSPSNASAAQPGQTNLGDAVLHNLQVTDERRFAWDGNSYTEHEVHEWYGDRYRTFWIDMPLNDATEHVRQPEAYVSRETHGARSTASTDDVESPLDLAPLPASGVAMDPSSGATEHARQVLVAPPPALPGLQCPLCKRELCQAHSLCFFRRINPQGGVEVHLMLKPEAPVPPTFVRAPETEKGATQTWQCACGAKMGDTRPIGPSKASMTAFKSSSVMLHGQHHTAKKSMWPRIYDSPLFNDIQVRSRDSFHGI